MNWPDSDYSKEKLRAAKAGDRDAQHSLAVNYAWGDGVRKSLRQARRWYGEAAGRGDGTATANFASMLWLGEGGPKLQADAMKWMRKASREGSTDADVFLGDISGFWTKPGVANARRAARHYALAGLRGNIRGLRGLVDLTEFADGRYAAAVKQGVDAGFFDHGRNPVYA